MSLFAEVDAASTSLALGRLTVEYNIKNVHSNEEFIDDIAGESVVVFGSIPGGCVC